ncbi:replication-relaxation family protein [Kineosporia babensis]|uniref:Replication-relaxation family protein n=1 Tax=Kineosporia babensis TaxID=499548 RepID=A0A9X1NGQ5_9ACTN|nr:replication-relaxation family protein [Kineosporia babensis]MCD5312981.1 replication-relaxation family protein [Kineosporia babensis]
MKGEDRSLLSVDPTAPLHGRRVWGADRARHVASVYLRHAHHLQPRDQVILDLLGEHQTLTTPQIAAILFRSVKRAKNRLYQLREDGWLENFGRLTSAGRLPMHWILGSLGERWVAAGQERPPLSPAALKRRMEALGATPNIVHDDGQRQVFVDLMRIARDRPAHLPGPHSNAGEDPTTIRRLARWWSPAHTASFFAGVIHPDGHGVWQEQAGLGEPIRQVGFFLEYDRGTETLGVLLAKLEAYAHLLRMGEQPTVLFWLESALRERHLHQRLAEAHLAAGLTVASTCTDVAQADPLGPAGRVWQIADQAPPEVARRWLRDLPALRASPGQTLPPPTAVDDPLRSLR